LTTHFLRKDETMPVSPALREFLLRMRVAEHTQRPEPEEWKAVIDRISLPGIIADIDEETYGYFLDVLPPKFMSGSAFAFAEGAEPLRLFWQEGEQFFCRQLTQDETVQFCSLAHIPLPW
jgi:hypothetical protein